MFCLASPNVFGTKVNERGSEHNQSMSGVEMKCGGKLTSKVPKDIMVCARSLDVRSMKKQFGW